MNNLYFCESCRTQLSEASDLHYVEENSDRGFCSEKCILTFYRPFMHQFELTEKSYRKDLALDDEKLPIELLESDDYLQRSLDHPTEIYKFETDIGQVFHTHITEFIHASAPYFSVLVISYIDNAPSFVFYRTFTGSQELLSKYRRGDLISDAYKPMKASAPEVDVEVSDEMLEEVEVKKSMILADMLSTRSDDDIGFEEFIFYDEYLEKTLHSPDEIYEFLDEHGDTLFSNIKSFVRDKKSFFYIVLTLPCHYKTDSGSSTIQVPIIGFPSNDKNLYPKYAQGRLINEKLKN